MVHSNQSLFTEQKWYLVSPAANGQWSDVVAGWAAAGATAASSATFYKFIYKLHEPVTNGVSLSQNSWDQIDITGTHDDLEENVGYFVYVETAGTESEPAAAALLQVVVSNETGGVGGNYAGDGSVFGISMVTTDDAMFDNLTLKSAQFVIKDTDYNSFEWKTDDMNSGLTPPQKDAWALNTTGDLGVNASESVSNTLSSGTKIASRNKDYELLRLSPAYLSDYSGYKTTLEVLATSSVQIIFYDSANATDVTFRADNVGAGEYKLDVVNV